MKSVFIHDLLKSHVGNRILTCEISFHVWSSVWYIENYLNLLWKLENSRVWNYFTFTDRGIELPRREPDFLHMCNWFSFIAYILIIKTKCGESRINYQNFQTYLNHWQIQGLCREGPNCWWYMQLYGEGCKGWGVPPLLWKNFCALQVKLAGTRKTRNHPNGMLLPIMGEGDLAYPHTICYVTYGCI